MYNSIRVDVHSYSVGFAHSAVAGRGMLHLRFYIQFFLICCFILVPLWLHFGSILRLRGPLGNLGAVPVALDPQKYNFLLILGAPWESFWDAVGINFRLRTCFGDLWGAFWSHLGKQAKY